MTQKKISGKNILAFRQSIIKTPHCLFFRTRADD